MKLGKPRRTAPSHCPACGHHFNAVTQIGAERTARPDDGDVTICIDCGTGLEFTRGGGLVELSAAQFAALVREDEDFRAAVTAWREMMIERALHDR